jgi:hypothetical protein
MAAPPSCVGAAKGTSSRTADVSNLAVAASA